MQVCKSRLNPTLSKGKVEQSGKISVPGIARGRDNAAILPRMGIVEEIKSRLGAVGHVRDLHEGVYENRRLYLDLMESCLLGSLYGEEEPGTPGRNQRIAERGRAPLAHTMIGPQRLSNVRRLCEEVIERDVAGDFIETGVWRGGAAIIMRATTQAYGDPRRIWVADSFEGLPPPDEKYPADSGDTHYLNKELAVSADEVRENFRRYDLLDERVRFLEGFFADTLPEAPIEKLAVARLDGDMYGSTWEALVNLYPKLSVGGYLIVDDYGAVPGCKQAVHDYRERCGIDEVLVEVDWTGVYWRREA